MLLGKTRRSKVFPSTDMAFLTPFLLLHKLLQPQRLQKNKEEDHDDPELEDEGYPNGILL